MKIICFAALVVVTVLSDSVKVTEEEIHEWEAYKLSYSKSYNSKLEEERRKQVFISNLKFIKEHNKKYEQGQTTFTVGTNEYADLTTEEFNAKLNGLKYENNVISEKSFSNPRNIGIPSYKDWRWSGCVTSVKNQKDCGSCWAFSTTGALEAVNFFNTSKLVSLSEQNLLDCTASYGNSGCSGGYVSKAMQYVIDNNGIEKENDYKYTDNTDNVCKYNPSYKGGTASSYTYLPWGDDDSLLAAVATIAPISVGVQSSLKTFHLYRTGVYYDSSCSYNKINHAVLLVGYGKTLFRRRPYWTIKNSWGWSWGEFGYMRLARNQTNMCGISSQAYYPTV